MRLLAVLLALVGAPAAGAAQDRQPPTLVLMIEIGAQTGHDLFTVERQPYSLIRYDNLYDTLRLERRVAPGPVAGLAAAYALRPWLLVLGSLHYVGLPFTNSCEGLFYHPDPWMNDPDDMNNREICTDLDASTSPNGAVIFAAGVMLRARPIGRFSPYVRASAGYASYSFGSIEMGGAYVTVNTRGQTVRLQRLILDDPSPKRGSLSVAFAGGVSIPIAVGRHLRVEVRDHILSLERIPQGPVALSDPATALRTYHHFTVVVGFDVVLERRARSR